MEFKFDSDLEKLRGGMASRLRQMPYAISVALNSSAFDIQRELKSQLPRRIHKPTPYTIRGVQVEKSTKNTIRTKGAKVGFAGGGFGRLPANAGIPPSEYMTRLIPKGPSIRTARTGTRGIPVPYNAKLNTYGNLPRNYISTVLNKGAFVATIKGISGIWSAYNIAGTSGLQLVVAFEKSTSYPEKPFDLFGLSVAELRKVWQLNLDKAIDLANRTST